MFGYETIYIYSIEHTTLQNKCFKTPRIKIFSSESYVLALSFINYPVHRSFCIRGSLVYMLVMVAFTSTPLSMVVTWRQSGFHISTNSHVFLKRNRLLHTRIACHKSIYLELQMAYRKNYGYCSIGSN